MEPEGRIVGPEGGVFPAALLATEPVPGVLAGHQWVYRGSSAEETCGDEAAPAAFDAGFPAKQKAWQPSQEVFFIQSHSIIGW